MSPVGETPGDTDGTERIQPVRVLDTLPLQGFHLGTNASSLEGDGRHDIDNLVDDFLGSPFLPEQLLRLTRSDGVIASMELPVGDIVDKCGQFNHLLVCTLVLGNAAGKLLDPVDVVPIVAGALVCEPRGDMGRDARDQGIFLVFHAECLWPSRPLVRALFRSPTAAS